MSDDLIRRSDAIKAFCIDCKGQGEPCEHSDTCKTMKILRSRKKIPAVEPKRGEWKPFDLTWGRSIWYCTACEEGTEVPCDIWEHKPIYNFCPNCGADMRGADDGTR